MSFDENAIIRGLAGHISYYTYMLLRDNVSIPVKEAILRMLGVYIDQIASKHAVREALREAFMFMSWHGYDVPSEVPSERKACRRLIVEYMRRREGEDVVEYYRRVGLFVARILAYYRLIGEDVFSSVW